VSSISVWATQPRSVSRLIPNCSPIRPHVPGRDAGSLRASNVTGSSVPAASPGFSSVQPLIPPSLMLPSKTRYRTFTAYREEPDKRVPKGCRCCCEWPPAVFVVEGADARVIVWGKSMTHSGEADWTTSHN
jgi:hypothetical protein